PAVVAVAEAIALRMLRADLVDRRARARRRQQRGLPAQRHGAERDQEAVAVLTQVHGAGDVRQLPGEAAHVGEEGVQRHRAARVVGDRARAVAAGQWLDRKSTRLNSSHVKISYAVYCMK